MAAGAAEDIDCFAGHLQSSELVVLAQGYRSVLPLVLVAVALLHISFASAPSPDRFPLGVAAALLPRARLSSSLVDGRILPSSLALYVAFRLVRGDARLRRQSLVAFEDR